MSKAQLGWVPKIKKGCGKPVYLMIADAIAEDIAIGRLSAQQRLPPQRELAHSLAINFTTVARAYTEAQRRGLVDSTVGRGTFVCGRRRPALPRAIEGKPVVDMTMNMPPEPDSAELLEAMQRGLATIGHDLRDLMRYQEFGGSLDDREAGALWLRRRALTVDPDRVLVVPGAQCALLAILAMLAPPGSTLCCEDLTYPGLRALAGQLGIRLVGLPMDAEGIDAVAFAAACAQYAPKALYCNPTLLNPTAGTISASRRRALADVARHYNVPIVEDDAYGFLPRESPAPLATLAPDLTFYISGLAKSVGAGLRIAYLVAPDKQLAARLAASLRATTVMASPVTAALASRWIRDGTAGMALAAIRQETALRQKMAGRLLPSHSFAAAPGSFHLWITLPQPWSGTAFAAHMRSSGIGVVASSAFSVGRQPPEAVRVCLGGPQSRASIEHALALLGEALRHPPAMVPAVV
jgi:DNA-binding transcriptional MocR family regulator